MIATVARQQEIEQLLEKGKTLTAIGEMMGVSRTTIANWRNGTGCQVASATCGDCGNPMLHPAVRCGMCQEELDQGQVAA